MFQHCDPGWPGHCSGWWGLGGIVPLVLFLVLAGVVVWAVLRLTPQSHAGPPAPPTPPRDPVLEEVRLRYARGEISREEFLQRSRDLGSRDLAAGSASDADEASPSDTG